MHRRTRCTWALSILALSASIVAAAPIEINGYRFEPGVTEPILDPSLRAPVTDETASYIVQSAGPVEETWKMEIAAAGGRIVAYIPENAFIVRMDGAGRERVASLPATAWVGPYEVAYRISPEIGRMEFRSPERRGDPLATLRVRVSDLRDGALQAAAAIGEIVERIDDDYQPGFVVRTGGDQVRQIAAIPSVIWVEELPETFVLNNVTKWVVQSNVSDATPIWDRGVYGEGQVVCEMDTGLDYNSCWFRDANNAPPGPTHRKVIDYRTWGGRVYDGCGTGHGTHVAGTCVGDQSFINPGNIGFNGMAYKAKIMIQDVGNDGFFDCLLGILSVPGSLSSAFTDAYAKGARVHTNSWGSTSNAYDGYAVDVDNFMWNNKDFLVLFANGNSGPNGSTVGSPATAKNCVSVGATKQSPGQETIASYSSRGPASDGRIKPTLAAPGGENPTYINSANNNTGNPPSPTCSTSGEPFQGTSMATPAVAGCALLVRDYLAQGFYPLGAAGGAAIVPSAALVKAILVNGSKDMGTADQPNNTEGWGRILLEDVLYFAGDARELRFEDEATGLATGEQITYTYRVDSNLQPLEFALVWTDYPAAQNANPALVNNLDLTVTAPGGEVFKGNVYSGGQSNTGGSYDARNVEECVRRSNPAVGDWTIAVRAANVPQGGRQPFALVATGAFGDWPEPPAAAEEIAPSSRVELMPARPNPFTSGTAISFRLPREGQASLTVHDISGRLVAALADGVLPAGAHVVEWSGDRAAEGIYFYRLETAGTAITRKVVRLR